MDSTIDLGDLRAKLMALKWSELQELADDAGLKASTVDKIRRNIAKEPGYLKVQALHAAILRKEQSAKRPRARLANPTPKSA